MNAIWAFTHDHLHGSENELTLQYLGIRLFNAAGASIKLALSGYYQRAFDQVRDVIETYFLVDYLSTYPEKIDEWKLADKKKRISHFGPGIIRNALDKRDGHMSGERKRILRFDLGTCIARFVPRNIANDDRTGQHGACRTVLRREEAPVVAGRDGTAPEPCSRDTPLKSRRQRCEASGDPKALP